MNVEAPGAPTTLRNDALEADLYLASRLRSASRLVPSAVHDVRQPLGNISLQAILLKESLKKDEGGDEPSRALRAKCLRIMEEEIRKLSELLDTVADHLRVPRETIETLNLGVLLRELEALVAPSCQRQKVTLTVRVPPVPVFVIASRDALKQAVINLTVNALDAMPEGGALELALDCTDARAVVSIADSGPGVPADLVEEIFRMHFTTRESGTGIGLHVARAVVESSGGRIRLVPQAAAGARFEIELPAVSRG
jgi:two-component system, NtrC family, sensor histidine kinase HydH